MERMEPQKTVALGDRTWIIMRASPEEQFEIECILLRMFGPAAAVSAGVLVDAFAKEVASFLADIAGRGDDFDLEKVGALVFGSDDPKRKIDTSDGRLRMAWERLLAALPDVGGSLLGEALPVLLARLEVKDVHRLMHLAVFGKVFVQPPGHPRPSKIGDFKTLAAVLVGQSPTAKWRLLAEALRFNYSEDIAWAVSSAGHTTVTPPVSEAASG